MSFDQSVFQAIHGLAGRSGLLDLTAIFFAEYFPYLIALFFVVLLFFEKDWKLRFYNFSLAALAVILARGLIVELIRFSYFNPRPALVLAIEPLITTPGASSFPSGHAAVFFALGMAVFYINRRWGMFFLASAAIIAVARVAAGIHWPSDILVGSLVGVLSAFTIRRFLLKTIRGFK